MNTRFLSIVMLLIITVSIARAQEYSPWALHRGDDSIDCEINYSALVADAALGKSGEDIISYKGGALWSWKEDIQAKGNALYALNLYGVEVFNIDDISNPELVKRIKLELSYGYNLMKVYNDLLFVGCYDRMYIFDISDPLNPVELSKTILSGGVNKIMVENDTAYVGIQRLGNEYSNEPAFYIFSIENPTQPQVIGKYTSPTSARQDCRHFVKVGEYIYSVDYWESRLEIISIADPTRPQRENVLDLNKVLDVLYLDGYLYVINGDTLLNVYNLSNPIQPALVNQYGLDNFLSMEEYNGDIYLVVPGSSASSAKIETLDISAPGIINGIKDYVQLHKTDRTYNIGFINNYALIPENYLGFTIVDISDPGDMHKTREYVHEGLWQRDVAAKGDIAYLINHGSSAMTNMYMLMTLDISDKANPQLINQQRTCDYCYLETVNLYDTLLFTSLCLGTNVYSLSDPTNPVYLSEFYTYDSGQVYYAAARDTLIFAGCNSKGLAIGSIADPYNPRLIAAVTGDFLARGLLQIGNLIYVCAWTDDEVIPFLNHRKLLTVDISDPANPVMVDELHLTDSYDVNLSPPQKKGNYLYIPGLDDGFFIVDISNPTHPDLANTYQLPIPNVVGAKSPEDVWDLEIRRDYLVLMASFSMQVFDISDPINPQLIQYEPYYGPNIRFDIEGNYIYTASNYGFGIFEMNLPPVDCGDANADETVNVSDAVYLINYIFVGGSSPDSFEAADTNCDGSVNVSDAVYIINYVFVNGNGPCDTNGDGIPNC